ncbi:hypothetical protein Dimus_016604, partial [Dionaea muscipula]
WYSWREYWCSRVRIGGVARVVPYVGEDAGDIGVLSRRGGSWRYRLCYRFLVRILETRTREPDRDVAEAKADVERVLRGR